MRTGVVEREPRPLDTSEAHGPALGLHLPERAVGSLARRADAVPAPRCGLARTSSCDPGSDALDLLDEGEHVARPRCGS